MQYFPQQHDVADLRTEEVMCLVCERGRILSMIYISMILQMVLSFQNLTTELDLRLNMTLTKLRLPQKWSS
jgi:hypothetical protein